jgi:hypothetical protein
MFRQHLGESVTLTGGIMSFSNSPSLNDYKQGIPNQPVDPSARKKNFRRILLILFGLAVVFYIYGFVTSNAIDLLTGRGSLTGQVVDQDGNPLISEVYVMGVDRAVLVDANGNFTYESIPAGNRSLVVAHNGAASEYPVRVEAGITQNIGQIIFIIVTPHPEP